MALFQHLKHRPARVLFVCLGNSYRSRMAESFANAYGSDVLIAESAGFAPARRVSETARRLMEEKQLSVSREAPRKLGVSQLDGYDLIVNLCEYGLPKTSAQVLKVPFPDPVGKGEAVQREVRDGIERLVETLIVQFRQAREEWTWSAPAPSAPKPSTNETAMLAWWRRLPVAPARLAVSNAR